MRRRGVGSRGVISDARYFKSGEVYQAAERMDHQLC
jgi:hypothetical protein